MLPEGPAPSPETVVAVAAPRAPHGCGLGKTGLEPADLGLVGLRLAEPWPADLGLAGHFLVHLEGYRGGFPGQDVVVGDMGLELDLLLI